MVDYNSIELLPKFCRLERAWRWSPPRNIRPGDRFNRIKMFFKFGQKSGVKGTVKENFREGVKNFSSNI